MQFHCAARDRRALVLATYPHTIFSMEPSRLLLGGNLLSVICDTSSASRKWNHQAGKKGAIVGFSAKSRFELAKLLAAVEWPLAPAHVTLTYGPFFPAPVKDVCKCHLPALIEWIRRQGWFGVWRLEFQNRSNPRPNLGVSVPIDWRHRTAPHYHFLLCGFTEAHERKIASKWARLSGNRSEYGCKITYRDAGRASWYLAMHAAKTGQAPDIAVGRWWGLIEREKVMQCAERVCVGNLNYWAENRLRRIVRKVTRRKVRQGQTFHVFFSAHTQARLAQYLATIQPPEQPF